MALHDTLHDTLPYYFTLTMLRVTEPVLVTDSYPGSLIAEHITDDVRGGVRTDGLCVRSGTATLPASAWFVSPT